MLPANILFLTLSSVQYVSSCKIYFSNQNFYQPTDEPAKANTSDLNEELGQVYTMFKHHFETHT